MIEKSNLKLSEWEYEFQQRNKHAILMADLWGRSYIRSEQELGIPIPPIGYIFTASSKGYVKMKWKKNTLQLLRNNLNDGLLRHMVDRMFKRLKEFDNFANKVSRELKNNPKKDKLLTFWKEFDDLYLNIIPWYYLPYYITTENMLSDKVKQGLEKYKGDIEKYTDLNNALLVLIFPTKEAIFQEEQRDFYNLLKVASKNKNFSKESNFKKKAEGYLKNYAWMKTFVVLPIEPLSYEELVLRVKEGLKNKVIEDYELKQEKHESNRKLADKLIKIFQKDEDLLNWIEWARTYGWFLTAGVEKSLKDLASLIPFYKAIAKAIGVEYQDWTNFTSEEIVNALKTGKLPKNELKDRKKGYFYLIENNKAEFTFGDKALELSKYVEDNVGKIDQNITELKGQPASPGKAKGPVCISLFATESHKVKQGDVLVCSMTSPDYVPAMKRAVAIVTDEGGLLSHASIVSRELGKPAVVGTKVGTKVLKNGDIVEVDAIKGVVKIISRKSP